MTLSIHLVETIEEAYLYILPQNVSFLERRRF